MTIININMCVTFINFYICFTGIYTKSYKGKLYIAKVKKQQLELDMEEQTGSKLGKEYIKTVYY